MSDVNHDPEQLRAESARVPDRQNQTAGEAAVSEAAPQAGVNETEAGQSAPGSAATEEWETNGGPLGCCLGVTVGLLLSLSLPVAARLIGSPLTDLFNGALLRVTMALVALVAAIICGYFGWKIGRRLYREYELSPRQRRRLEELERKYAQRQRGQR
ncbi:hypothetical protein [Thermogemmatispora onikobensis]|uniref:hypothetical protein n=1 Tax=Thermogemmatispora onikobensis TaxID=732234 RepID=UPI0008534E78|nr:hypothetical protein [Thermogemmatispora onikobensis]